MWPRSRAHDSSTSRLPHQRPFRVVALVAGLELLPENAPYGDIAGPGPTGFARFRSVELRTDRLILRPPVAADIDRLVEVANDRRIARNLTSAFPHPYTRDDAVAFVESAPKGLAIVPVEPILSLGPGMVGVVGGNDLAGDGPSEYVGVHSFGYWLHPDAWGHGFATEAATAYLDHIAQIQRPRRFEAGVYGWNPASGRVLEKLGFELEGRRQARIFRFGEVTDELIYGKVM